MEKKLEDGSWPNLDPITSLPRYKKYQISGSSHLLIVEPFKKISYMPRCRYALAECSCLCSSSCSKLKLGCESVRERCFVMFWSSGNSLLNHKNLRCLNGLNDFIGH